MDGIKIGSYTTQAAATAIGSHGQRVTPFTIEINCLTGHGAAYGGYTAQTEAIGSYGLCLQAQIKQLLREQTIKTII